MVSKCMQHRREFTVARKQKANTGTLTLPNDTQYNDMGFL